MANRRYLVAAELVDCGVELPGMLESDSTASADLSIVIDAAQTLPRPAIAGHTEILANGDCFVNYGPFARFTISADGSHARIVPGSGFGDSMLRHVIVDHVIPRRFALIGHIALHSTAVDLGGGAVALMGASGKGKSTLSGALVARGGSWVADDFLLLDSSGGEIAAVPTIVATRLCEDSAAVLGLEHELAEVILDRATKRRWTVSGASEAVALKALFIVDRRSDTDGDVSCERVGAAEALTSIAPQWFLSGTGAVAPADFLKKLALVLRSVPVFRLSYPNSLDRLSAVADMVQARFDQYPRQPAGTVSVLSDVR